MDVKELVSSLRRRAKRFRKVAVIMGGESEEAEISLKTGKAISSALLSLGYDVKEVTAGRELPDKIKGIDAAFIALHGRLGEDGTVQGLCEIMQIPYTGCDPVSSAVFMNKKLTRFIMRSLEIPHPNFKVVSTPDEIDFKPPFVIKPVFSGSSLGLSVVKSTEEKEALEEALRYSKEALVEELIEGREITVGILDDTVLGTLEIRPGEGIFSFSAKYQTKTEYIIPPEIPPYVQEEAEALSLKLCKAVGTRGCVRVDIKLDKNLAPYFLEVNTIPGMTKRSLVPMIAKHKGIEFEELVEAILGGADLKI